MELELIKAKRDDAELLNRLQKEAYLESSEKYLYIKENYTLETVVETVKKIISENSDFYKIIYRGETIGGMHVQVIEENTRAKIESVFIVPKFQRQGIGKRVLEMFEEIYKSARAYQVQLIKEEAYLTRLFEIMSYNSKGTVIKVDDKTTIVLYKKINN